MVIFMRPLNEMVNNSDPIAIILRERKWSQIFSSFKNRIKNRIKNKKFSSFKRTKQEETTRMIRFSLRGKELIKEKAENPENGREKERGKREERGEGKAQAVSLTREVEHRQISAADHLTRTIFKL